MTEPREKWQEAAYVLVDMLVAYDPNRPDDEPIRLAASRLAEIDVVTATRDDDEDATRVNITPILEAWSFVGHLLADATAAKYQNLTTLDVLAHVRPRIDNPEDPGI